MLRNIYRSITTSTAILSITLFFWILVITSLTGLTDFLSGRIVPAVIVAIMILLPVAAVIISSASESKDDQAHAG